MGAEQVGYLVKGPKRIGGRAIGRAVRECVRHRQGMLSLCDGAKDAEAGMAAMIEHAGERFDPADIPEDPSAAIREFADWWNSPGSRDTSLRDDPDDPKQRLLYAGEMSWGDEPGGQGYGMLKRAFCWGFAEALGIR